MEEWEKEGVWGAAQAAAGWEPYRFPGAQGPGVAAWQREPLPILAAGGWTARATVAAERQGPPAASCRSVRRSVLRLGFLYHSSDITWLDLLFNFTFYALPVKTFFAFRTIFLWLSAPSSREGPTCAA